MTLSCPGFWQIVGFRNRIIHGYADVDPGIVRNEVPLLLEKYVALLEESEHGG